MNENHDSSESIIKNLSIEKSYEIGNKISDFYFVNEDQNIFFEKPKSLNEFDEINQLNSVFQRCEIRGIVDLGEVKVNLTIGGSSKPIDASICQIFIKREFLDSQNNPVVKWENITPKNDKDYVKFSIYVNDLQTFTFDLLLPVGKYSAARILFFADGWKVLADSMVIVEPFEIVTNQIRIKKPFIEIHEDRILCPNDKNKIIIPFTLKFPEGLKPPYNAWWAMAKGGIQGSSLFQQKWLAWGKSVNGQIVPTDICKISDGPDKFWYVESFFEFEFPKVNGLYNMQFGVFDNNWKDPYHWVWPGVDLEVGGDTWIAKCPVEKLPPRLRVKNGRFVKLDGSNFNFYEGTSGANAITAVRGASWGNAYGWTNEPAYNRSGYFSSLRYLGHRICRFLFDPDKYSSSLVYRHRVLDSINKILLGGMYPLVGPHNLHVNVSTPSERDNKFLELCEMIANDWKGLPIMYAIASEPKELTGGWPECKALWEKSAKIVRAIDPDAFIIVPCHGYSKTSTAPEAADLLDRDLVDAYSYHPYHSANDALTNMKPLLDTGVGIIIEEYGCGNVTWQKSMNIAMQKISKQYPNLLAFLTWAWTKAGQDACPMVLNGDLANITLTESGNMQALDIAIWDSGKFIDESGTIVLPPVTGDGNIDSGGGSGTTSGGGVSGGGTGITINISYYSKAEVDNLLSVKVSETKTSLENSFNTKFASLSKNMEDNFKLLSDKLNLISDKVNESTNDISFLAIQEYITALANCKLNSASILPNAVSQLLKTKLTVNLTSPAPKDGAIVYLAPSVSQLVVQPFVLVPEGQTTATVEVSCLPITAQFTGRISCTFNGKTITPSVTFRLK
jgi:hypothetical protein